MRLAYLLATLIVLCAVVHASALPVFTTKFVLPENTEALPDVTEKVGAYIENLIVRQSLDVAHNWTLQVVLDHLLP
jgi:hypothetical protein